MAYQVHGISTKDLRDPSLPNMRKSSFPVFPPFKSPPCVLQTGCMPDSAVSSPLHGTTLAGCLPVVGDVLLSPRAANGEADCSTSAGKTNP